MLTLGNLSLGDHLPGHQDVRIDRSSILGNPFALTDEDLRDLVCETYRDFLWKNLKAVLQGKNVFIDPTEYGLDLAPKHKRATSVEIVRELLRLMQQSQARELRLMCWCVEEGLMIRCHGETVIKAIEWMREQHYHYDWHKLLSEAK